MKTFLVYFGGGKIDYFDELSAAEIFAKKVVNETGDPAYVYVLTTTVKKEVTVTNHLPPMTKRGV
jgi:hypothetical protein